MYCFVLILISISTAVANGQTALFPDCKSGPLKSFPICDQSLSVQQRATDLVSRMTIQEKANWLINTVQPIPRLGLPSYQWWNEALHGVMYLKAHAIGVPEATSFPSPLNLASTFNVNLIHRVANIISTEARAANNENITGLNFFTPNINLVRDPRWGRGQETPGEDPFLASQYVSALVRGLQEGEDSRYLKIAATCKHFIAYDMDAWNGASRWTFDAQVSDLDLVETYLPPFEACFRNAHVASIMGSLNAINGIPACANRFFFQTIARDTFNFDGYAVCDCSGIQNIMTGHHYTSNNPDTVAVALHAGIDLDCGNYYSINIPIALNNQTIVQADLDQASLRTFSILIRLGYFDSPEQQIYRNLNRFNINTPQAQQLALLSAQESIVLLKNMNNNLPLNLDQLTNKTIALIGPSINATELMQSSYHGPAPFLISPLMAFNTITSNKSINIQYAFGCQISGTNQTDFAEAIELARRADFVFYIGGLDQSIEREDLDRISITLPDIQLELLQQLEKVVRSPLNAIIMSGSSLDLSYIRDSPQYGSLIWTGYPGEFGGTAIASVIFGQYNPAGRLPITFYPDSYVNQVSMLDMRMRPSNASPGRTYKFYTGQPVFEFGYGLSYTSFHYYWYNDSNTVSYSIESLLNNKYDKRGVLIELFRVNVTNTGSMNGDDVVLAYIKVPQTLCDDEIPPIKQLFGFERIYLNVGETKQVFFPLNIETLFRIDRDGSKWIHPGEYDVFIGNQHMFTIKLNGSSTLWERFK
ncbi:unnamed protein product [Rotaria sp. Silwood2]|nr:unnamed protein product [Rotaria sp. Silwood2]CAF4255734.1 unnamed protein product [Rotaria sp. Silwood2]